MLGQKHAVSEPLPAGRILPARDNDREGQRLRRGLPWADTLRGSKQCSAAVRKCNTAERSVRGGGGGRKECGQLHISEVGCMILKYYASNPLQYFHGSSIAVLHTYSTVLGSTRSSLSLDSSNTVSSANIPVGKRDKNARSMIDVDRAPRISYKNRMPKINGMGRNIPI